LIKSISSTINHSSRLSSIHDLIHTLKAQAHEFLSFSE